MPKDDKRKEEEAEAGLELALEPGELEEAEPVALPTAPEAPAAPKPEPRPAPQPEKKPEQPHRQEPLTPQEQQEDAEMAELKAMLYGTPKPAKSAPVEEMQDAPEEVLAVEPEAPAAPEGPAGPPLRSWAVWTPCRWMPTSSLPPTA